MAENDAKKKNEIKIDWLGVGMQAGVLVVSAFATGFLTAAGAHLFSSMTTSKRSADVIDINRKVI